MTAKIAENDSTFKGMRQIAVYMPYKGETIVARIPLTPEIEPKNVIELRAALTGMCAEACNQCLQVAGQIDEKGANE